MRFSKSVIDIGTKRMQRDAARAGGCVRVSDRGDRQWHVRDDGVPRPERRVREVDREERQRVVAGHVEVRSLAQDGLERLDRAARVAVGDAGGPRGGQFGAGQPARGEVRRDRGREVGIREPRSRSPEDAGELEVAGDRQQADLDAARARLGSVP